MMRYYKKAIYTFSVGIFLTLAFSAYLTPSAYAQNQTRPPDSVLVKYSLFYEYYKNKDYESALPYLKWLLKNAPTFRGDKNWERAIKVYEGLAEREEDDQKRRAYLDTALMIFDQAVDTLKKAGVKVDEFEWTLRKGHFIQSHQDDLPDLQDQVLDLYLKAFEMDPERLDSYYAKYIVAELVRRGEKDQAVAFMEKAEPYFKDEPDVIAYFDRVRNTLFTTPEERMAFLEKQLQEEPDNIEIIRELLGIYRELGMYDKVEEMAQKLAQMQPSAESYMLLAQIKRETGDNQAALSYYRKALELAKDPQVKRDIYYNMAQIYLEEGQLQKARTYARRALQLDPKFGPAYILIGDIYVTAVQQEGKYDRKDRAVFWLALDYYERAKQVDPSVAAEANQKIRTYRKYLPSVEDLFFMGLKPGDPYKIDYEPYAWINETTKVRKP